MLAVALAAALSIPSGIQGKVLIDPARPVCAVGEPCSAPDARELLAFWRGSARIASTTTRADGGFRLSLAPGRYRITLPRQRAHAAYDPQQVTVPRGRYVHVTIRVDVGIR